MNRLLDWYHSRDQRERRTLFCGALAVLVVAVVGTWLNLHGRVSAAEARLDSKRRDLAWLQVQAPQLAARPARSGAADESLLVLIDRVARDSGVATSLAGSQQAGNSGAYRVRLEKVSFDAAVTFLGQLVVQHGVAIDNAGIDVTDASGVVNATLVLRKP